MNEVFADTGYWFAMVNPDDNWHRNAQNASQSLGNRKIVTTEMVLAEFFALMSGGGSESRALAVDTLRDIERNPNIEVVPQTHEQFEEAVKRYAKRLDKDHSLTDCASFLLMESRGIYEALAHDRDFLQAGFIPLMRDA